MGPRILGGYRAVLKRYTKQDIRNQKHESQNSPLCWRCRMIAAKLSTFMINERLNRRMLVIMQSCFLPSNCYFYENSFWLFFLLSKFSFKDTGNSRNSKNGGDQLYFSLPLLFGQEHSDIIFATLRIRWLPRISNRIVCDYHTATQWDLKPWFW